MELGVTKTNIQAMREPGGVEFLTGGAHVWPIGGGPGQQQLSYCCLRVCVVVGGVLTYFSVQLNPKLS